MERIVKFVNPTVYDKAKFGSIWETKVDDLESILYIQAGDEEPNWLRLNDYMERLLHNYFRNQINKEELMTILSDLFN